jgi:hypothetical protein
MGSRGRVGSRIVTCGSGEQNGGDSEQHHARESEIEEKERVVALLTMRSRSGVARVSRGDGGAVELAAAPSSSGAPMAAATQARVWGERRRQLLGLGFRVPRRSYL